jgi:hypothetical protein
MGKLPGVGGQSMRGRVSEEWRGLVGSNVVSEEGRFYLLVWGGNNEFRTDSLGLKTMRRR